LPFQRSWGRGKDKLIEGLKSQGKDFVLDHEHREPLKDFFSREGPGQIYLLEASLAVVHAGF